MAQAGKQNTRTEAPVQFRTRGYVLSEDAETILKDLFAAIEATAFAYDMDQGGTANFDLSGDQVAAVMRTWAHLGKHIISSTPFANDAMASPRELH